MPKKPRWDEVEHEFFDLAPGADVCVLCGQPEDDTLHPKDLAAKEHGMFNTNDWYRNASSHTTDPIARTLQVFADNGWANESFEIANGQGETELEVALIEINRQDLFARYTASPGTMYDAFRDEVTDWPAPATYIVTRNTDGVSTGYKYDTYNAARQDYNYLRSRY